MTVEEAQEKKKELEQKINDLCSEFETETNLTISEIEHFTISHGLTEHATSHVNITVKL